MTPAPHSRFKCPKGQYCTLCAKYFFPNGAMRRPQQCVYPEVQS